MSKGNVPEEKWQRDERNKALKEPRAYIINDLKGFIDDPPDTLFQLGYMHSICDMAEYIYETDEEIASLVIRCRALGPHESE